MIYKWLNEEKSRYYIIQINKSGSEGIILNYNWGSCNSNRGGKKNIYVSSQEEVADCINKMMARRKSRGYKLIFPS